MSVHGLRPGQDLGLRISLYLMVLLGALTASVSLLAIQAQRSQLRRHVAEAGRAVVELLAGSARLAVFAENREELRRVLGAALVREDVRDACAFDREGRLLVRVGRPGPAEGACGLEDARDRPGETRAPVGARYLESADAFTFWEPVVSAPPAASEEELYFGGVAPVPAAPVVTGHVVVRITKDSLRQGTRQIVGRGLVAGLLFLLLGGAVAHRVVRAATRPLRDLAATVRLRGTPVAEAGDDVGLLTDTYSGLLQALERAFADLQALRDELEDKVDERTAELRKARDRLEERVAERTAELDDTYRQLLHAEKLSATGRLAASVAHEFNNPVFGIRNVLQSLLSAPGLGQEERDLAALAVSECDRLGRLVRDLQSFSRPTSGRAVPVDLRRVVEAMGLLCAKEFRRKHIALEVHFADDVPPVRGVEDQLKQVVLNLLANAGDAIGGGGGTVRVSAERHGAEVALRVADTGKGVLPEHRERIFDPFFTTKPAVKGTGLGLSVSHGIVRRHGGGMEVESEPGAGATFTVTLPIDGAREP